MPPGSEGPYMPGGRPFQCEVAREGDRASVRTIGELDMGAVADLSAEIEQLREAGCRHVTFDLRGLSFLDSSGLRFLLGCHAEGQVDGYSIALIPGPPAVQRVFELTRTEQHLPFVEP